MIGSALLVLIELPLLAVVLGVVLPVHRQAGLTAGFGLLLSLSTAIGALVVEGGLIFWMVQQPPTGAGQDRLFIVMGVGMLLAEFVPPLFHALSLGLLARGVHQVLARMAESTTERSAR